MAKEIPFFKFFVGEWANGDITAENYKTQGVFINICSIYWTKEGELSEVFLRKKIKANKEITLLIESEIIKVENKNIIISFLDEQLNECQGIRVRNSEAGKKSARQRAFNKRSTGVQPKLNESSTKSQPIREDKEKIREEKKRKDYKPEFKTLFSKLKGRPNQEWISEMYEDRKERTAGHELTLQKYIDNTLMRSLQEFTCSCKVYNITFYSESGCVKYFKMASKGYITSADSWRKLLSKIRKRSEENISNIN